MLSFATTAADADLIVQIARRAHVHARDHAIDYPFLDASMDLTATHANGNPLADLLGADDANFAHDIYGIRRHLDRTTGTLRNCFVPRFSAPEGDRS